MAIPVKLPPWAFRVALEISKLRHGHFKNRFKNVKLREIHRGKDYVNYVEGIMGYLGDIACAIYLGLDPLEIFFSMVISTDCLSHRDESDLKFRMCNIDVKVEDFGKYHGRVINRNIRKDEPYGCRLINEHQWRENSKHIDYYVFATTDRPLSEEHTLDRVKTIYLLGFISRRELENNERYRLADRTPAGKKLHTRAKIIPGEDLKDMEKLKEIEPCYERAGEERCREAIERIFRASLSRP